MFKKVGAKYMNRKYNAKKWNTVDNFYAQKTGMCGNYSYVCDYYKCMFNVHIFLSTIFFFVF